MKSRLTNGQLIAVMNELYFFLKKQGVDSEVAKDIVQESVYKMMIHIDAIDTGKYKAWLFKVALNLYYDYWRRNKKSQAQLLDENIVANSKLIEDLVVTKENQNMVRLTLERLPFIYKQMLLLKYDLDWSYQQIADYLDMRPNSVKTYLARARAKFRELYLEGKK